MPEGQHIRQVSGLPVIMFSRTGPHQSLGGGNWMNKVKNGPLFGLPCQWLPVHAWTLLNAVAKVKRDVALDVAVGKLICHVLIYVNVIVYSLILIPHSNLIFVKFDYL